MDVFCEYIVNKKKSVTDFLVITLIGAVAIIATYILMLVTMIFGQYNLASIGLLLIAGCWWGAITLIRNRNIEFEYILTNHELDIDRIVAKSRRKRLCTIDFRHIDLCASISDPAYTAIYANSNGRTVKNYAGDLDATVYFVDFTKESEQMRVIFQPSRRILDGIKKSNPNSVTIKEGDL